MKKFIIVFILFGIQLNIKAQYSLNEDDALRFSQTGFGGSARSTAMAGAFGALGADMSVLSTNPAGIGLYKKSEFTFSPTLFAGSTNTNFNGTQGTANNYNLFFNNIGLVITSNPNESAKQKGWKNIQFGIGFNKLNSFDSKTYIQGYSPFKFNGNTTYGTIMDIYYDDAYGKTPDQLNDFDTKLAFLTYLLDTVKSKTINNVAPDFANDNNSPILQQKSIKTSGALNEMHISFGGNFKDKLYLGATLGIPILRYTESSTYTETIFADSVSGLRQLSIKDDKQISATGLNLKLGAIYRATEWLRLGASFQTPSIFFNMDTHFTRTISSDFSGGYSYSSDSPEDIINNSMITPLRATGSLGFIIGKLGMIDVDYEYLNYASTRLSSTSSSTSASTDNSFDNINNNIKDKYGAASNIRIGGELNLAPFAVRAGYALYGNPYKSGSEYGNGERTSLTFGVGIRNENFFIDFAYVNTMSKSNYYLYQTPQVFDYQMQPASKKVSNNSFITTVGFKF